MDSSSVKILLVEDNPGDVRLIRVYLAEAGMAAFELAHADRLAEGIRRVREADFDVVLLDLSLPDASGLETITKMHEAAVTCPIVVLTGLDDEAVGIEALRRGAQDYLTKGQINSVLLVRAMRYAIERKHAETALRESEERYRDLFENSTDLIQSIGSDGKYIFTNRRWRETLGYSEDEVARLTMFDVLAPECHDHCRRLFDGLMHGEQADCAEATFLAKDGRRVFVEGNLSCSFKDGKPVGTRGFFRDITKRKQAEAALAESELKFRTVFESSNDAMMLFDSGKFLDCNEATLRVFGYSTRDEFLGKHPGEVSPPLQADGRESRVAADENIAAAFRDGRNFFEWLHERADGTVFPADVLLTPFDYRGRRVLQATVRDITPRKIAEAEIAEKNTQLVELNDVKNQLLGMAAHDLRNPLAVVTACSDFLLSSESAALSEEKRVDFLRLIKKDGEFMLKLIDDLLDVAKIESGRLDLELATGDLCGLIEENLGLNRMLAERKGIRLDFTPECGLPPLRFDRGKVEQVLNNLISNALKFSAPGTAVTVQVSRVNDGVVVSVRDHGQGIPAAELDKLFKPFGRTTVRSTAGENSTGLGLAICRKIVEGHHGRIWAESEVGRGSTFSFSLPVS